MTRQAKPYRLDSQARSRRIYCFGRTKCRKIFNLNETRFATKQNCEHMRSLNSDHVAGADDRHRTNLTGGLWYAVATMKRHGYECARRLVGVLCYRK